MEQKRKFCPTNLILIWTFDGSEIVDHLTSSDHERPFKWNHLRRLEGKYCFDETFNNSDI